MSGSSTRDNDYLARVEEQLAAAKVERSIFDRIEASPLKSTVMTRERAGDDGRTFRLRQELLEH